MTAIEGRFKSDIESAQEEIKAAVEKIATGKLTNYELAIQGRILDGENERLNAAERTLDAISVYKAQEKLGISA